MVELKQVTIENFYSIDKIVYTFQEGITNIIGTNLDNIGDSSATASNGAAKSSILYAISQCLFNKSFKNSDKLESTYNRVTGKPYKIVLEFISNDKYYTITNDRNINKVSISCDGEDITPKGIKNQLKLVEAIIGMDYLTFNSLTFMNQQTMLSILDMTSDKNIIHKFFDLHKLSELERVTKINIRDYKKDLSSTTGEIIMLNNTISEFNEYTEDNIDELYKLKTKLICDRDALKEGVLSGKIRDIHKQVTKTKEELNEHRTTKNILRNESNILETDIKELSSGTCPLCGSVSKSTTEHKQNVLITNKDKLKEVDKIISKLSASIKKDEELLEGYKQELHSRLNAFNSELSSLSNKILVAEEKNRNYRRIKDTLDALNKDLKKLQAKKVQIENKLDYLLALSNVIKSGQITQIYLDNFTKFFNNKLKELLNIIDLDFTIKAVSTKGGILFDIYSGDTLVQLQSLSSGEKTRVALVIVITSILALEVVASISINLLILDELLSVLDDRGIKVFRDLLNVIKTSKNIFVVQHHNEIPTTFFDRTIEVVKKDGLSTIKGQ